MKKAKKKQVTCNSLFHNVISQKEISKDAKFENSKISKLKCLSQIKIWE